MVDGQQMMAAAGMNRAMRRQMMRKPARKESTARNWQAPLKASEMTDFLLKGRLAYEALKHGSGSQDDFDELAGLMNVGVVLCERSKHADKDADQLVLDFAVHALLRMAQRKVEAEKHLAFDAAGLADVAAAMSVTDYLLTRCSPQQFVSATLEWGRRVEAEARKGMA
jgi:hypothetical protein